MLTLLSSLKGLTKHQVYTADNHVFRLHYKFTVGVLAVFSLILTYKQFFGNPIDCTKTGSKAADSTNIVDTFCWADSTYSSLDAFDKPVGGEFGEVYPGIGRTKSKGDNIYHKYYQWVCFVLALQAVLFYVPRYMWKAMEGERIKNLTMGLNVPAASQEDVRKKQDVLVKYLKMHRGLHSRYTFSYVFCECLNLVNVVGQMYLLNSLLGGEFNTYGLRVVQYSYQEQTDKTSPMIKLFPRLTKCRFIETGPSGDLSDKFFFCVLPLNIINEKIFLFLWFWFVILIAITSVSLVYRLVLFNWSTIRAAMLKARCPVSSNEDVHRVISNLGLGDWFIVYQLAKNVEAINMGEVLHMLADELDSEHKSWVSKHLKGRGLYAESKEDLV